MKVVLMHGSLNVFALSDTKGQKVIGLLPSHLPEHPSAGVGTFPLPGVAEASQGRSLRLSG